MGDLKPIGSEKLQGIEKINRILEISRYKEIIPNAINENSKSVYELGLHDGKNYQIYKEKLGYVIKRNINESTSEYLEPMKNRKYYPSYSQALKRLNLIIKEVNRVNDIDEELSLFGEQKKYVLKTPKMEPEPAETEPMVPAEPPSVPTPELPPSPEATPPTDVEGPAGEELPPDGMDMDSEVPEEPIGDEGTETGTKDEGVTFRLIQKLTGKLTQKIREFDNEKGLTSENIKYVINMVLSSFDLTSLSEEDKEDIMLKFEEEEGMGDEETGGGDLDMGAPDESLPTDEEVPAEEPKESYGSILDSIFKESKVDKVISKYFDISSNEKDFRKKNISEKRENRKFIVESKMKDVSKLTESFEQELASKRFLERNPQFVFVGRTNKKNLVFEHKNSRIKISPKGEIV